MLDPVTQTWTQAAPLLCRPIEVAAAATPDGTAYVAGIFQNCSWQTEIYHVATDSWSLDPRPPLAGEFPVMTAGTDGALYLLSAHVVDRSMWFESYTPATATWQLLPAPPAAVGTGTAMATLPDGRIAVFGGHLYGSAVSSSQASVYDPATQVWSALPSMPAAHDPAIAAVSYGGVFVMGGAADGSGTWSVSHEVDVLQLSTGTWTQAPPLPVARSGSGAGVDGQGRVHVAGGCAVGGTPFTGCAPTRLRDEVHCQGLAVARPAAVGYSRAVRVPCHGRLLLAERPGDTAGTETANHPKERHDDS